jgi:hypothetical protein
MERRNQHLLTAGEDQWTFSQIFSITQMISVLDEVLHFLLCSADEEEEGEPGDEEQVNAQAQQPDSASIRCMFRFAADSQVLIL